MEGHAQDANTAREAVEALAGAADDPLFLACNFINPHDVMFVETSDGQSATRRRPLFLETMPFARPADLGGFPETPARNLYGRRWRALPATLHADHEELLPNSVLAHQAVVDARFGHLATNAEYERYLDYYLNALRESDARLGTVLDAADALDARSPRDVIIVFTSDHGEMLGAHGCRQKGNLLYRENLATPFLVRDPRARSAGRDDASVVSAVDVWPTLLDYAGLTERPGGAGKSLVPTLRRGAAFSRSASLVQFGVDYGKFFRRVAAAASSDA